MTTLPTRSLSLNIQGPTYPIPRVVTNLSSPRGYSPAQYFINLMTQAEMWRGPLPNGPNVPSEYLDDLGYVAEMPPAISPPVFCVFDWGSRAGKSYRAGSYRLTYDGVGSVSVSNSGGVSNADASTPGVVTFDLADTGGNNQFLRINITSVAEGNHPRNMLLLKTTNIAAYESGQRVNSDYGAKLAKLNKIILRHLNSISVNGSTQSSWADRILPGSFRRGVSFEDVITIHNELMLDAWVCIPHLADDNYITQMGTMFRDNLDPSLIIRFEWSNEVWNNNFNQSRWAQDQGLIKYPGISQFTSQMWIQAERAVNAAQLLNAVFTGDDRARIKHVMGGSSGATMADRLLVAQRWLDDYPMEYIAPHTLIDEYALSNYYGANVITRAVTRVPLVDAIDVSYETAGAYLTELLLSAGDGTTGTIPQRAALWRGGASTARALGIETVAYEGGNHTLHAAFTNIPEEQKNKLVPFLFWYYKQEVYSRPIHDAMLLEWNKAMAVTANFVPLISQYIDVGTGSQFGWWSIWPGFSDADDVFISQWWEEKAPAPA